MKTRAEKDAINAKRRERYRTDPVYRAKTIESSKKTAARCRACKTCHEKLKKYQREYRKNRMANDPEFKTRILAINLKFNNKRYKNDPDYREYLNKKQREYYWQKKEKKNS